MPSAPLRAASPLESLDVTVGARSPCRVLRGSVCELFWRIVQGVDTIFHVENFGTLANSRSITSDAIDYRSFNEKNGCYCRE